MADELIPAIISVQTLGLPQWDSLIMVARGRYTEWYNPNGGLFRQILLISHLKEEQFIDTTHREGFKQRNCQH